MAVFRDLVKLFGKMGAVDSSTSNRRRRRPNVPRQGPQRSSHTGKTGRRDFQQRIRISEVLPQELRTKLPPTRRKRFDEQACARNFLHRRYQRSVLHFSSTDEGVRL